MPTLNTYAALALVPALAALLLGACSKQEAPPDALRPVRVLRMAPTEIASALQLAGEVRARYESQLGFRVGGKVVRREVDVGQTVKTGQVLARLDPQDLQLAQQAQDAALAAARADMQVTETDLKRFRALREKNFISQADLERREAAFEATRSRFEAAQSQLQQLRNQVGYSTLVADTAGVITSVEVESGQVVAAGQTVLRIARPGGKEIAVAVPEGSMDLLRRAGSLEIRLSALPGRVWQGTLRELSPRADPATRTFAARVSLPDAGPAVELGMSATLAVRGAAAPDTLQVPLTALYTRNDQAHVWIVDEKTGAVSLTAVKTAGVAGNQIVIASGLKPGDLVVTAGAQLLTPGQRVRLLTTQP
ncbi:MAG: efflux RND transporter periplasmic adaptor subunit [Burkholderiales bacterium]|nr:efflux RND transporter periplasmic adaptor subunit [Burkholderiales bacterium]